MKAVILCGGLGTRLSEETDRTPKPMVEIGGKPILWHIMKMYSSHGVQDFVICLGYKGYIIKEYFSNYFLHMCDVTIDLRQGGAIEVHQNAAEPWRITLVDTGHETQTGGRLRRIRDFVKDETFCFTYGDGVSDVDITKLIDFHRAHGRKATVTSTTLPGRFGVLETRDGIVTRMAEKVDTQNSEINGGFFVLEPDVIDYVDDDLCIWEREPMERLAREGELMAYRHDGFWQPMDTLREKRLLEDLWNSNRAPWKNW